MSTACPSLASTIVAPTPLFSSLHEAATVDGLIGDGLVASHCRVTPQWHFLRTRSTAGKYPSGSLASFFRKETQGVNPHKPKSRACRPYLDFDAPYLSDIFLQRPSSCGLALDIGANIGLAVAPPAAKGWRVLAIEPNEQNVDRLRLNIALNGWRDDHVMAVTAAASDRNGSALLFSPPSGSRHAAVSSLTADNVKYFKRTQADARGRHLSKRTRLLRLDEYFSKAHASLWSSVRLLKVDTQGHELPVLTGMGGLLGAPPYPLILMEYEEPMQRGAGFNPGHVLDVLRSHGYHAFCPVNTTAVGVGQSNQPIRPATRADMKGASAGSSWPVDPDLMLPGGDVGTAPFWWRLGDELRPQPGMVHCIDGVFIHEKMLKGRGGPPRRLA